MNTRDYKVYTMTLAVIIATSFILASVARAQTRTSSGSTLSTTSSSSGTSSTGLTVSRTDGVRNPQWYEYSTGSNPLTGMSWSTGSFGPDFGIGQTGSFTNTYSPWTGASSTGTGGMTYAGGLPIYTGAGSLFGNMNYGPLTSYVNTMSGIPNYNTAAGYSSYGLYGGYSGLGGYGGYRSYGGYGLYGGLGGYGGYGGYGLYGGLGGLGSYGGYGGYGLYGLYGGYGYGLF